MISAGLVSLLTCTLFCQTADADGGVREIMKDRTTEKYEALYEGGKMPYRLNRIHQLVPDIVTSPDTNIQRWFIVHTSEFEQGGAAISAVDVDPDKRQISNLKLMMGSSEMRYTLLDKVPGRDYEEDSLSLLLSNPWKIILTGEYILLLDAGYNCIIRLNKLTLKAVTWYGDARDIFKSSNVRTQRIENKEKEGRNAHRNARFKQMNDMILVGPEDDPELIVTDAAWIRKIQLQANRGLGRSYKCVELVETHDGIKWDILANHPNKHSDIFYASLTNRLRTTFSLYQITNYKGRDKCDRAEVISQYEYRDITSLLVLPKGSNIFLIADTILHQIILKKAGETLKYLYGNESNSLAADKYIGPHSVQMINNNVIVGDYGGENNTGIYWLTSTKITSFLDPLYNLFPNVPHTLIIIICCGLSVMTLFSCFCLFYRGCRAVRSGAEEELLLKQSVKNNGEGRGTSSDRKTKKTKSKKKKKDAV